MTDLRDMDTVGSLSRQARAHRWEALLLVLSFPVVIPSLIFSWLGAKRWGRIDFPLLAIDGVVLMVVCARSPVLLAVMAVALAASIALWLLRRGVEPRGIFLGYSNAVAWRLILAGALIAVGCWVLLPWPVLARLRAIGKSEAVVSLRAVEGRHDRSERLLHVPDAELDWGNALYRVAAGAGQTFVRAATHAPMETWVPVRGADAFLCVVFPGSADSGVGTGVRGIHQGGHQLAALPRTAFEALETGWPGCRISQTILAMSRAEYVAREGLWAQFRAGLCLLGLPWLGGGLTLLLWAVWVARLE